MLKFITRLAAAVLVAAPAYAQDAPTFTRDIAPVLYENCVVCHRPGEIAPMSLTTYREVRPWARSIKNKVLTREMPPWHATPDSMTMSNDPSLSQKAIDTIAAWVDAGAPEGDPAAMPRMPIFAGGWRYGEPDVIIDVPLEFQIPPEGEKPWVSVFVPSPFPDDVWIQAMQIRTDNPAVVHHETLFVSELPEGTVLKDGLPFRPGGEPLVRRGYGTRLVSYVAGRGWERYPDGVGRLLPKGSYIEFNLHHQASGRPERERSRFGIWLAKAPVKREMINVTTLERGTTMVEDQRLAANEQVPNIPPFAENWKISNFMVFEEPATLYALSPHMHLRGKDMKFILTYPDGRDAVVLNVPNYDFTWQTYYELETPLKIPAGSKLTAIAHYDNSPRNRWNPAPEKEVFWTEQSWDEMYNPQIRYTWDRQDLTRDDSIR